MAIGDAITFPAKYMSVSGTDVSEALVSCQITVSALISPVVHTAGSTWQKGGVPTGKKTLVAQVELLMGEFGAGTVYALMEAGQSANAAIPFAVRKGPATAALAADNPEWQFSAGVPDIMPFGDGTLQANVQQQFTLTASGDVTVDITP